MDSLFALEILKEIFRRSITNQTNVNLETLNLNMNKQTILQTVRLMSERKWVKIEEGKDGNTDINMLEEGRKQLNVVLSGGAYDLIHTGHLQTLREAASKGNFLVVVLARDITVQNRKRLPIHNENQRLELLQELRTVDLAILGHETDHMIVVNKIKPDIVAIGSDQDHRLQKIRKQLDDIGLSKTQIIRLESNYEGISTTEVITEILERFV